MKTLKILSCGVAFAAITAAAYAQDVTGTVYVIGTVDPACAVIEGEGTSSSFSDTINMGQLAGADGRLDSGLTGSYTNYSASFTVVCNTSTPNISLEATSMEGETTPPDASYTNVVGYTAHMTLDEVGPSSETFDAIADAGATTDVLAAAIAGTPDNVTVYVDTLTSDGGILTAGGYGSQNNGAGGEISITISPEV